MFLYHHNDLHAYSQYESTKEIPAYAGMTIGTHLNFFIFGISSTLGILPSKIADVVSFLILSKHLLIVFNNI